MITIEEAQSTRNSSSDIKIEESESSLMLPSANEIEDANLSTSLVANDDGLSSPLPPADRAKEVSQIIISTTRLMTAEDSNEDDLFFTPPLDTLVEMSQDRQHHLLLQKKN